MKERQVVHGIGSEPTVTNREAAGLAVRIVENCRGFGI